VLAEVATAVFGADRVRVVPRLDDAIETAISLAESEGFGTPGVLVTGSVVAVGEARTLLVGDTEERATAARPAADSGLDDDYDPADDDAADDEDAPEVGRDPDELLGDDGVEWR
jgi:dihydrofolate synthase/folylpolyglutamate synthase